jgi:hypothetical protein
LLVSAELRWFWKDALPQDVEQWFRSGEYPPGGGTRRVDEYLVDRDQTELGMKKRGSGKGVEIKGLVALGRHMTSPFEGRVQVWTKWSSETLTIDHLPRVSIAKTRWLRKYDTTGRVLEVQLDSSERPVRAQLLARGCQFELSAVDHETSHWRSIGFEAFGELNTIEDSLERTLAHLAADAPDLSAGLALSYPEWLARFAGTP